MKRPSLDVLEQIERVKRNHPAFVEWILDWKQQELEQLPNVPNGTQHAQGRCQVLGELARLLKEAPNNVAKS